MKGLLRRAADSLLDAIYPPNLYCMACGDAIEPHVRVHALCDVCIAAIDWIAEDPYEKSPESFAFDELWSCCRYGAEARAIMNGFKTGAKSYYADALGLLMAERTLLGCERCGIDPEELQIVSFVPMHPDKQALRGYNQAELLAEAVCRELGLKLERKALVKRNLSPSMRFSDGITRRTALSDAFSQGDSASEVKGKHVLLIDDVSTTGSTLDACSLVLKQAGASKITALCFAAVGDYIENPF